MSKKLTKREEDFSQWYHDIVEAADLAEHAEVKGSMIIKPYGYSIWENFQKILDKKIKETGAKNAYFPLLIPESFLNKEKDHVEGFSPELAVVTHAGGKELGEPLVVRPTSETIINSAFSKWISSYRDLPLMINQWANVVRWEMRPRLFLRTTEFLWQEGHTAHIDEESAEEETLKILNDVYIKFARDFMAIPVLSGEKTESERFAGALRTYTIEGLMQDGKALQMGTSHNLGQNFAKVFDIKYSDDNNEEQYVWQTSWGVSTRLIGGLIMAHSDDKGLVLPPKVAPIQIVIVPIWKSDETKEKILNKAQSIKDSLDNLSVKIDDRTEESVGNKFFEWEKKGVPVRIELGENEIKDNKIVYSRRDTGEKSEMNFDQIAEEIPEILNSIQNNLLEKLEKYQQENTYEANDYSEFKEYIKKGGFVKADWCGESDCEEKIKEETKATIRCIPFDDNSPKNKACIKCDNSAKHRVIFARSY